MSDNKNVQDGRDRSKVSESDEYEFQYLERKLNVDKAAIREAIEQVGNSREKVEEYLTNTRGL